MIDEKTNNMIERTKELENEIKQYILDTPHYLWYWIYNAELQDFIKEYPTDYEDRITITIESFSPGSASVKIEFEDHPDGVEWITRYCCLPMFREETEKKWIVYKDKVKNMQIEQLKEELNHYRNKVNEIEKQLEELE